MENSDIITDEQNKLAVKQDGSAIRLIKEPSVEIQKLAVERNGVAIIFIEEPIVLIQKLAVEQNGLAIRHIKEPSVLIQKLAVEQNGLAIQYIIEPTDEIYELAIQQNPDVLILQPRKWKTENKLFNSNKDNTCSISYDTIELNDTYCTCLTCSNSFKSDVLIKWIKKVYFVQCVEQHGKIIIYIIM